MIFSIFFVVVMSVMFLYMMNKSKFARTRRMALIPLGCALVELIAAGYISFTLFPLLTAALIALRALILLCCIHEVQMDAAAARRRTRRIVSEKTAICQGTAIEHCNCA